MRQFILVLLAVMVAASGISSSNAAPYSPPYKTIRGDRGGYVLKYALAMKKMERSNTRLRFAGRCDSACTLYLGLPSSQVCATPSSAFGFHLPYGGSPRANKLARSYMLRTYPSWVKTWLAANGGLTTQIKVMDYDHVSRHLPTCKG